MNERIILVHITEHEEVESTHKTTDDSESDAPLQGRMNILKLHFGHK
jgi:hypothetical protein